MSSCGTKLSPRRLVEEVKMMILEKWQKVFVVGLGKKINSLAMRINRMEWNLEIVCSTKFKLIWAKLTVQLL